jgi:hypothetical protein
MALVSSNAQPLPSQSSQLDKYKALFDASHPDRTSSQTQSETTQGLRGADVLRLSAVPEEEESQSQILDPSGRNGNTTRGTKRSRPAGDGGDVEMPDVVADADVAADSADGTHRAKRRAVDVNATQQQPATAFRYPSSATTTAASNTQPSKPEGRKKPPSSSPKLDTDENFLRAVNSTKRGKKLEDDFDREFNLLRITKPKNKNKNNVDDDDDVAIANTTVAAAAPWDEIDDFGDVGIRGNFMVLVEMDVERGSSAKPILFARTNDDAHPEWIGKPNFKKFKSVSIFSSSLFSLPIATNICTENYRSRRAQAYRRTRPQRGERLWHRK